MPKDAKVRRIAQAATVGRGSVVAAAATSSPATPAPTASGTVALVGQALTDATILIGDSADLAAERAVSGDATVNRLGVLTLADTSAARSNLGLGSMATQAASAVAITGGSVTGITDLAIADGGTGASSAGAARTNLGLGTGDSPTFAGLTVSGDLIIDTSTLAVDSANNRVGFGTATPGHKVHFVGAGTIYNQNAWWSQGVGAPFGWNTTNTSVYIANGYAGAVNLEGDGALRFYTAASGLSGGAITFVNRLTLLNSGTLLDTRPLAVVRNSAALTCTTGVDKTVTFDTEIHDADGFHDTGANTERLTVPAGLGGKYWVWARASFQSNATGFRALTLWKNAGTFIDRVIAPAVNGERTEIALGTLIDLAAGDYVWFQAHQNSGGNLDLQVISSRLPTFGLFRVGG